MEAGIKERERYRDMSWLMPSIDLDRVFTKLGIVVDRKDSKVVRAFCPDHHLFTGRKPSDPNWVVSIHTGETFCFTESRGSNLVWTVCRILKCEPNEAAKFLTGVENDSDMKALELSAVKFKASRLHLQQKEEGPKRAKGLDTVAKDIANRKMSDEAYQFFMHPPGKKFPTNIRRETVDRYKVFERRWGQYDGRVIIPYFMRHELVGFCAIDILGEKEWRNRHPDQADRKYKKVLYPLDFASADCLFGFDDCQKNADFIILTEGAREVMKLTQEGFPNVVAILGAYLSDNHLKLITSLHPKQVVLMFDGDDAGVATTSRVAEELKSSFRGKQTKKCFLPRGRDPKTLDRADLVRLIEKT